VPVSGGVPSNLYHTLLYSPHYAVILAKIHHDFHPFPSTVLYCHDLHRKNRNL
jgi:hypothetical protein